MVTIKQSQNYSTLANNDKINYLFIVGKVCVEPVIFFLDELVKNGAEILSFSFSSTGNPTKAIEPYTQLRRGETGTCLFKEY